MRIVTAALFSLGIGLASNLPAVAADAVQRPNIVVFLADDLGYGDLGCYGNSIIRSPHLDAFARQGLRLTQCYAACPVCSPSRSAILTGRTPYRNGVFTWIPEGSPIHLRRSEVTIATLLKQQAGYTTCHVGKWHLNGKFNSPEQPQPNDHGYDHWFATQNNAAPSHKDPKNFVRDGQPAGPLTGFSADLVVGEAIDWLSNKRVKDRPFFLTVWTHEPHLPIESDPELLKIYREQLGEDPDRMQHHANVTQLDRAFGRLMKYLDEAKLTEQTLVFFTSDNGPEGDGIKGRPRGVTGGLRGRKRNVYEGGIREPGMIRWPAHIQPGSTSDVPVIGSDIFATICAITGVKPPEGRVIDGTSLVPLFQGKELVRPIPLYWRYHDAGPAADSMKIAMRKGDWKILADVKLTKFELYNLRSDPKEATELSNQEPKVLVEMKQALIDLNTQIEREGPTWWQGYNRK
jgi:arylsulfatase A